jgi:L-threonylcarbamoyladenylate synthase
MTNAPELARPRPGGSAIRAATPEAVAEAGRLLAAGHLIAFPTETVYGLGADAADGRAVAGVFAAKGRPRFNPLIVHCTGLDAAGRLGRIEGRAAALAGALWPGPLTLVVERRADAALSPLATAGLATVALRVPAHPVAQGLLRAAGRPLAAPSANLSGHVSPTTAAHVAADLGSAVAMVLDGGPCRLGLESTIIACGADGPCRLLRPGAVSREAAEAVLGEPLAGPRAGRIEAPGQAERHYAPVARLRLEATAAREGEALVAFGPAPAGADPRLALSQDGDLTEAAARLFQVLRDLDAMGIERAAVMPIPDHGLGEAINDRLRRAARRDRR